MSDSTVIVEQVRKVHPEAQVKLEPVSIIVPAYNEVEIIGQVLDTIMHCLSENSVEYELIVVDDGSTDGTAEGVEAKGVRVVRHDYNRGYGSALKTGIRQSRYPLIAIIDADGTYPADVLQQLVACMDQYDMAVGSRTGEHVAIPFLRRPAKWFLKKLADYLSGFNIPDLNSGLRVFRRKSLRALGIVHVPYVEELKRRHFAGTENNAFKLWGLMFFVAWHTQVLMGSYLVQGHARPV